MAVLFSPALEGIRCAKIRIVYLSGEIPAKHPIIALQRRSSPKKAPEMAERDAVTRLTRSQTGQFSHFGALRHIFH
jgi:hypothetical protein